MVTAFLTRPKQGNCIPKSTEGESLLSFNFVWTFFLPYKHAVLPREYPAQVGSLQCYTGSPPRQPGSTVQSVLGLEGEGCFPKQNQIRWAKCHRGRRTAEDTFQIQHQIEHSLAHKCSKRSRRQQGKSPRASATSTYEPAVCACSRKANGTLDCIRR